MEAPQNRRFYFEVYPYHMMAFSRQSNPYKVDDRSMGYVLVMAGSSFRREPTILVLAFYLLINYKNN